LNIDNLKNLNQFTGGGTYRRNTFGMVYTEGVSYLAENADCWWLIDAIESYHPALMCDPDYRQYQFWDLVVTGNAAVLTCRKDSDQEPTIRQVIAYTDFPLPAIALWVECGVLILPSEH
jgi:hypothetical protein